MWAVWEPCSAPCDRHTEYIVTMHGDLGKEVRHVNEMSACYYNYHKTCTGGHMHNACC